MFRFNYQPRFLCSLSSSPLFRCPGYIVRHFRQRTQFFPIFSRPPRPVIFPRTREDSLFYFPVTGYSCLSRQRPTASFLVRRTHSLRCFPRAAPPTGVVRISPRQVRRKFVGPAVFVFTSTRPAISMAVSFPYVVLLFVGGPQHDEAKVPTPNSSESPTLPLSRRLRLRSPLDEVQLSMTGYRLSSPVVKFRILPLPPFSPNLNHSDSYAPLPALPLQLPLPYVVGFYHLALRLLASFPSTTLCFPSIGASLPPPIF